MKRKNILNITEKIDDYKIIEAGKHGVMVRMGLRGGVYLPQVATENGWDREEFMNSLCAQKSGIPMDAWKMFEKQDSKCALSGMPIEFVTVNRRRDRSKQTASLDRIDSEGDYTIDNVQWVHKDVNRMKNVFDNDYFIEICKKIASNCSGGACEVAAL